jgi:diguanylate cyclase (GGDEF)-like protein
MHHSFDQENLMIGNITLTAHEMLSCMELGKALTSELNPEELFSTILRKISELLPAENWSLLLLDQTTGELNFEVSVNLDLKKLRDVRLQPGQGIAGKVALEQKPQFIENVAKCEFFSSQVDQITGCLTSSIICVPLVFGGRTVGVIEVVNPKNLDGDPVPLLSIIADYAAIAVENMHRYREIQNLAIHDDLTSLYNTRYLYRVLANLIRMVKGTGDTFSVIFMDIDHFKQVVDSYGHLKGSQAIQEIAGTIRECLIEPAFGVAYGGDEFVLVLPGLDKVMALKKAEEIRARMKQTVYLTNHGHQVNLSASFGVANFPDDAGDVLGLLALADRAMFDVKEKGKDAVKSA